MQTYIRELLRSLAPLTEASMVARVQADATRELPDRVVADTSPVSSGARRAVSGLRPALTGADLVHGLDVDLPVRVTVPTVATLHDLAVFDVPWTFSKVRAAGERALLRRSLRHADRVVSVSNFTAERLRSVLGIDSVVAPLAAARWCRVPDDAEVDEVRGRLGLPESFVLQVGTVEPRKGIDLLVDACRQADVPLVLGGSGSTEKAGHGVIGLGYVAGEDLPALYRAADVTAYASLYEGFGLPPLEAMACGGAVVSTDVGGIAEAVGDGARLVPARSVEHLVREIRELTEDTDARRALVDAGRRASSRLTWDATAAATLEVYRDLGVAV